MNENIRFVYRFYDQRRLANQSASFKDRKNCTKAAKRNLKRWTWIDVVNIVQVDGNRNTVIDVF